MDDRPGLKAQEKAKAEDPDAKTLDSGGCMAAKNTCRLLYQRYPGGPRVYVDGDEDIVISVGGSAIVMPLEAWHAMASKQRDCIRGSIEPCGLDKGPAERLAQRRTDTRAEVVYREVGDVVEGVSLQGVLTFPAIVDRYGQDVLSKYRNGGPYMYARVASDLRIWVTIIDFSAGSRFHTDEAHDDYRVVEQQELPRDEFFMRLEMMRECGKRLAKIVKASRAPQLIRAKI